LPLVHSPVAALRPISASERLYFRAFYLLRRYVFFPASILPPRASYMCPPPSPNDLYSSPLPPPPLPSSFPRIQKPSSWCRITFESQQVRQATAGRAGAAGEARDTGKLGSAVGGTICPAGVDHQTPRPNFGQTLAHSDLEGREPILATPDPELEPLRPPKQSTQQQRP